MPTTVAIKPELIRWAIARSGLPADDLSKFPIGKWESGEKQPTLNQLEAFAKRTRTPLGYMFLSEPPEEKLPLPDFRTVGDTPLDRPSPNLLDIIQAMQRRQAWMRDFVIAQGQARLSFVGSVKRPDGVEAFAAHIGETLGLSEDWAEAHSTWEDALRALRNRAEDVGILVAVNSVVGLNNHRPLDPEEFRGFVLSDEYAPLVFVNGADSKSAQMFTMAHELAHLWMGRDGLFNLIQMLPADNKTERFCNRVAAEFLVPKRRMLEHWRDAAKAERPFSAIARLFKVSPLVAARRALDLRLISKARFFQFYRRNQDEWQEKKTRDKAKQKGGNFYAGQDARLGRRFAYAVVRAAREGRLSYRDAYRLTDLHGETFDKYAASLVQRMRDEQT